MSTNWLRYFDLMLTDSAQEETLNLSDFKVLFTVSTDVNKTGSEATVAIYNLSQDTQNAILNGHYKQLKIVAGYQAQPVMDASGQPMTAQPGNYSEIFSGEIRYAFSGITDVAGKTFGAKADTHDAVLNLQAIDGHKALLESRINTTVAAGYDVNALYSLTMQNFNPFGISAGTTGAMPATRFPRGRVLYKLAHQVMDDVAAQCRASWQFVDGKLQMIPDDNYLEQRVVINRQTGMIGVPTLSSTGVTITCLINNAVRLHGLVQIDQATLMQAQNSSEAARKPAEKSAATDKKAQAASTRPADIAADGVYIVRGITWSGDSRGTRWYMTLTCEPLDRQKPLSVAGKAS